MMVNRRNNDCRPEDLIDQGEYERAMNMYIGHMINHANKFFEEIRNDGHGR
jgi:hypothetical protein